MRSRVVLPSSTQVVPHWRTEGWAAGLRLAGAYLEFASLAHRALSDVYPRPLAQAPEGGGQMAGLGWALNPKTGDAPKRGADPCTTKTHSPAIVRRGVAKPLLGSMGSR